MKVNSSASLPGVEVLLAIGFSLVWINMLDFTVVLLDDPVAAGGEISQTLSSADRSAGLLGAPYPQVFNR